MVRECNERNGEGKGLRREREREVRGGGESHQYQADQVVLEETEHN